MPQGHRATAILPSHPRRPSARTLLQITRTAHRRGQRRLGRCPSDLMRRHPRPVPRPDGIVPRGRRRPRHQLPVHGRLCGPGLLLARILPAAPVSQGPVSRSHHAHPRQPRIASDYHRVRVLRRMHPQVRQRQCLAVLLRGI